MAEFYTNKDDSITHSAIIHELLKKIEKKILKNIEISGRNGQRIIPNNIRNLIEKVVGNLTD